MTRGVLHEVSWRDLFPWLVIFRSFRLSISLPVLFLATVATLLTPGGWQVAQLFLTDDDRALLNEPAVGDVANWTAFETEESRSLSDRLLGDLDGHIHATTRPSLAALLQTGLPSLVSRMEGVYYQLSMPFRFMLRNDLSMTQFAYFLLGGLWTLAVWSLFGGVITRIAVVRFGRDEKVPLATAFQLTLRRYRSFLSGPLALLLVVLVIVLGMSLVGLLMRTDFGLLIAGALWFVVLGVGFLLTLIFFGLLFGWPLMWPTISAEVQGDAFEAVQRSFSYTFERPAHYLFYAFVAAVTGGLGWIAVDMLCEAVIASSLWSVSYGAGADRMQEMQNFPSSHTGSTMIWFWISLVRSVQVAYGFSFFWCAASAIYLVLRQNVDETEFDEIYMEGEESKYDLPTLKHTDTSVPQVDKGEE